MRFIVSIIVLIVSAFGVFFVFSDFEKVSKARKSEETLRLADFVPQKIGGMQSRDLPLGNTEEVIRATESVLNVTDWLNREYQLPDGRKFNLYISYWEPNKEDVVRASTHTPDRCWVKGGWRNLEEKKRFDDVLVVNGRKTFPAYYREYTYNIGGGVIHRKVWFWFIVDGKRYDYSSSDNYVPNPVLYIKNVFIDALKGSPEQFFIRIDSDGNLEDLLGNADFKDLLERLGSLVLFPKTEASQQENK